MDILSSVEIINLYPAKGLYSMIRHSGEPLGRNLCDLALEPRLKYFEDNYCIMSLVKTKLTLVNKSF